MLARHVERLAEPARPGAEQARSVETAAPPHDVDAVHRLERPDQDCCSVSLALTDEVQAPVDAVRPVDVRMAGWAEHRRVPRRPAPEAVSGRILRIVGLHLHDRPADAVHEQGDADQLRRHVMDAASEELPQNHLEELRALGRPARRFEQLACAATEIGEIDTA